jgi:hypothetical protein
MAEDKKTLGLTDANKTIMEGVVEKAGFKRDMDAAKFAFALAVNRNCEPAPIEGVGTIWNVGSFDEAGEIKALIQNLFPNTEFPYRALESLMNTGFSLLAAEIKANPNIRIEDLLRKETETTAHNI